jgi:hypothetical protein
MRWRRWFAAGRLRRMAAARKAPFQEYWVRREMNDAPQAPAFLTVRVL